jgi:Tfp pilus assembly protein PilP
MKTAKSFVSLAVLGLAALLVPVARGQGQRVERPSARAPKVHHAPKPAKVHQSAPAATPAPAQKPKPEESEPIVSRRDPFAPLIAVAQVTGGNEHLPPGKAGLVIATVHVDGAVKAPNGMIAVVSNPSDRVYFVRVGDHLYDGAVEKINLEGVTFRENSKDAFGKPVERLVTKRIYPSAGEQQ